MQVNLSGVSTSKCLHHYSRTALQASHIQAPAPTRAGQLSRLPPNTEGREWSWSECHAALKSKARKAEKQTSRWLSEKVNILPDSANNMGEQLRKQSDQHRFTVFYHAALGPVCARDPSPRKLVGVLFHHCCEVKSAYPLYG